MSQLVLPLAVMAVTVAVAAVLVLVARHLLKQRAKASPEVVFTADQLAVNKRTAEPSVGLAHRPQITVAVLPAHQRVA